MTRWQHLPAPSWAEKVSYRYARPGWLQVCATFAVRSAYEKGLMSPASVRDIATLIDLHTLYMCTSLVCLQASGQCDIVNLTHEAPAGMACFLYQIAVENT